MKNQNLIAQAAARISMRYPFWNEILYSCAVFTDEDHPSVTTAATDGRNIIINREFYAKQSADQQVTLVLHELCHKIFLHCSRRGMRDPMVWNIAADHTINNFLKNNHFPEPNCGEGSGGWCCDPKYDGWTVDAVYKDLMEEYQKDPSKKPTHLIMQDILEGNATPEEREAYEGEVKALVERAIANAKAIGRLPAGIDAGVVEAYKPQKEAWYNTLHRYMQSLANSEYNWARLNRRTLRSHGYFSPRHLSESLGDIVLFIDTSGSCSDKAEQANFCGHLNAILAEARPHRMHVYYFDCAVYEGEVIEAGEFDISTKPKGGGGTSFVPLFKRLDEDGIEPEVCIVLTDLYGDFPSQGPEYPLLWASTSPEVAPFGETIHIE